jgi:circadian clock protein KaiB
MYVSTGASASERTVVRLRSICDQYFPGVYELEIVDIREDPWRAAEDCVLVTPTLIKLAPPPLVRIIGDLQDTEAVVLALRSEGAH